MSSTVTKGRFLGGLFLVIGTSIGGGMLALPIATAPAGFFHASLAFLGAWVVMTIGAFFILEVNLNLPEGSNLISMAHTMLGKPVALVTWFCYLSLLYMLLSAYIAGGSDLLGNLLASTHVHLPHLLNTLLFTGILGTVIFKGIRTVDLINRIFMSGKLLIFVSVVCLLLPHTATTQLQHYPFEKLSPAVALIVTSFGFGSIIPSVRTYFQSHTRRLVKVLMLGSLIPLICYLIWIFVIQGTVASEGAYGLIAMNHSTHPVSDLVNAMDQTLHNTLISSAFHLFTSFCVVTSFLGVALGLSDFLADGLSMPKEKGCNAFLITLYTVCPPLLIVIFKPGFFITGLGFGGILCLILLAFLPACMATRLPEKSIRLLSHWPILIRIQCVVSAALILFTTYQAFS